MPQQVNILTVEGAVKYLSSFRLPLTFSQAANYLQSLWQSANMLALYRHYFPNEFAASTASDSNEIIYGNSKGPICLYSPKEKEFLGLVQAHLFPFYEDFLLDEEDERRDLIYLPGFGIDWWSAEFDELEPGWQLLLFVIGLAQTELKLGSEDLFQPEVSAILATIVSRKLDWERLKTTCAEKVEPLCFLPLALDMLDHDTGNIFLDPSDEAIADPLEWSIEDMDFLIEQYREAGVLGEKVSKFMDWLTASPIHLEEVIQIWNECQQRDNDTNRQP